MTLIPLDLYAEVTTATGATFQWGGNRDPADRVQNLSFGTKIGEGFSQGSGQLVRRIDLDYPDLKLVNSVRVVGADGSVAYEGRLAAMPRELSDTHAVNLTMAGWMAHAKDRKFTEIYVDRDLGSWGEWSLARRSSLLTANTFRLGTKSDFTDPTDSLAGFSTNWQGSWVAGYNPISEAWYDAGSGNLIRRVSYQWKREGTTINNADTNWTWAMWSSDDDKATSTANNGEERSAGPSVLTSWTLPTPRRYAFVRLGYNANPGGSDGTTYGVAWQKLAVYGNHGLMLFTGEPGEPSGVLISDVIRDIANRWCPELDASGVRTNNYVIQHLSFKDPVFPHDAFLEANKFAHWNLAVWEDKKLVYEPFDLTDYDWEVRTDDPGTKIELQGFSTDDLFNGVAVTYTDLLTRLKSRLTPETHTDLRDLSRDNPWNEWGIDHWDEIELSTPTLQESALQLGRMALSEKIRPKTPGTITVRGYIRDRRGVLQPAWKPRAGDTVSVSNFPNEGPRLIQETNWDDDSKTLTLSVEQPAGFLDAYLDRVNNAVGARGLT